MKLVKVFVRLLGVFLIVSSGASGQVNWMHINVGSASYSTRPVICSDPLNNIHIAWTSGDPYGERVQYVTNQSGAWHQTEVYGSSGRQCYNVSITADRQGFAYIVFRYEVDEIRYVTNRNITSTYWDIIRQMSSGHFHESSIELDQNFNVHIFAQDDSYGSDVYYQSLNSENIVMSNITQFFYTAIDQYDVLHFLGHNESGIYYTNNGNGSWSDPVIIDQLDVNCYHPSITCDKEGNLHAVFAAVDGLYYMNNVTGDWSAPVQITSDPAIFPDIVVDENGKAHVAWYNQVDDGTLYYSNNVNGSWLSPSYVTTINEDVSSATEDAAHVESKIALDTYSNSVYIVYIDDGNENVMVAKTTDFNLQSPKSTDTTSILIANSLVEPPDTLSTSTADTIDLLSFTISDQGGDGAPTKIRQIIIQAGSEMSDDVSFHSVFSKLRLSCSDGDTVSGKIYGRKVFFGTLDAVWKEIPEGSSVDFTVSGILRQTLMNMDGKAIDLKINGLYDTIIDTVGSRFASSNQNVSTSGILFQVIPDHFEFVNLGNDFYGENLVESWWMELRLVDKSGVIASSVSGVDVTLSAVKLDGVTQAPYSLQSPEGLTKTITNGMVQWTDITYPDTGRIRILATSSILSSASDTIIVMPINKTLVIGSDRQFSIILDNLGIQNDFYSENNYAFPNWDNLSYYDKIIFAPTYLFSWYMDSTAIKNFLDSGTDTNRKCVMAIGNYGLGNNANSAFAKNYFGGLTTDYISHDIASFQGVSGDPITDGLSITVYPDWTGKLQVNDRLPSASVILTYSGNNYVVGVKNDAEVFRTILLTPNFWSIKQNLQFDSLLARAFRWFEGEEMVNASPVLSNVPHFDMD